MNTTSKLTTPVCQKSLKILGDYWTMMIIDNLSQEPKRFRDLERNIEKVNTATLSTRLKNMKEAGLIKRNELSRADVSYELTALGRKAIPILEAVNEFGKHSEKLQESCDT